MIGKLFFLLFKNWILAVWKLRKMSGRQARNTNRMKQCCFDGTCFDGFLNLWTRIGDLTGKPMFHYSHLSPENILIDKVPKGLKWNEFLFDYWDYKSQKDLTEEFTTSLDVNHYGNDKIYVSWRCLDRYKGRFHGHDWTQNMIDICLYILTETCFWKNIFVTGILQEVMDPQTHY